MADTKETCESNNASSSNLPNLQRQSRFESRNDLKIVGKGALQINIFVVNFAMSSVETV